MIAAWTLLTGAAHDHVDMAVYRNRLCSNLPEGVDVRCDFQLQYLRAEQLEVLDGVKGLRAGGRDDLVAALERSNC